MDSIIFWKPARNSYNGGAEGVEHLVYASSSSVYGGNTKLPFSTEDMVDHPVSLYAATKKCNELLAHAIAKSIISHRQDFAFLLSMALPDGRIWLISGLPTNY